MIACVSEQRVDPLAPVTILGCLQADERAQLARSCRLHGFPAGASVIGEDRDGREVLFVLEGRVRVIGRSESGRLVSFAEIGAGGHVGEIAALDDGPRTADVEAITDCRVAVLPPGAFDALLHRHSCVAVALLRHLARIIRTADLRITELSTLGAAERLARELLRRAVPSTAAGSGSIVEPMPTQEHLASVTGATRETVARLLAQLQHAGLTRRSGSRLTILDMPRLGEIAGGRRPAAQNGHQPGNRPSPVTSDHSEVSCSDCYSAEHPDHRKLSTTRDGAWRRRFGAKRQPRPGRCPTGAAIREYPAMQRFSVELDRHHGQPPPLEGLLPAAGAMTALCLILLSLLFVI